MRRPKIVRVFRIHYARCMEEGSSPGGGHAPPGRFARGWGGDVPHAWPFTVGGGRIPELISYGVVLRLTKFVGRPVPKLLPLTTDVSLR